MKRRLDALALNFALVLIAVLTLAPLLWMVAASLMPTGEANTSGACGRRCTWKCGFPVRASYADRIPLLDFRK